MSILESWRWWAVYLDLGALWPASGFRLLEMEMEMEMNMTTSKMSPEARQQLRIWIEGEAVPELAVATAQSSAWYLQKDGHVLPGDRPVLITNAERICDLARRVEIVAAEVEFPLDRKHPWATIAVLDEKHPIRSLTQREIMEAARTAAMAHLQGPKGRKKRAVRVSRS